MAQNFNILLLTWLCMTGPLSSSDFEMKHMILYAGVFLTFIYSSDMMPSKQNGAKGWFAIKD